MIGRFVAHLYLLSWYLVEDDGVDEDIKIRRMRIEDLAASLVGDANIGHCQQIENTEACRTQSQELIEPINLLLDVVVEHVSRALSRAISQPPELTCIFEQHRIENIR